MEKQYEINGKIIRVAFRPGLVQIKAAGLLLESLRPDLGRLTGILTDFIFADYEDLFVKPLRISKASLMVEIWGHLYGSRMATLLARYIPLGMVKRLRDFIVDRGETIDCGERGIDSNRLFWDMLSAFNPVILMVRGSKRSR